MQWDENDATTAYTLNEIYSKMGNRKKAKEWALKICEMSNRLENTNSGSNEAYLAKEYCAMVKRTTKGVK